jgi:raffinose/stachyose/melibiose transport system permease protein
VAVDHPIVVPTMRPAMATMLIINFINGWNDFIYPLILPTRNTPRP